MNGLMAKVIRGEWVSRVGNFMIDIQLQLTDQLLIIIGSSHFFGDWVLEFLCNGSAEEKEEDG